MQQLKVLVRSEVLQAPAATPAPSPTPTSPDPLATEKVEIETNINSGEATAGTLLSQVAANNFPAVVAGIEAQIFFWQAQVANDPTNVNTQGTLGYFAQSALDFWQSEQEINDALNTWAWYSREQAGKPFDEMQPIDLWYQDKKFA